MTRPANVRLTDAERFDWLRLIRSENVGPRTFLALMRNFGAAGAALDALPDLARRGGASRPIRVASRDEIEREFALARKIGVRFIALGEPDYPPALRQIDSAPPVLALQGREEALQQPAVAIVGSRNASAAGLTFADRLARGLGQAGYVVVSGLARGVDQRAHFAALETGTIGVLAGGHARPYPPEAVALIPRIAEYGAIVSEMPIEWEPRGRDFPRRNRLVSGLSLATAVIEAARGSGSLITARFAAEQNREVFAAPGSPLDPRAEGTNDLLRQGANLCARAEDVLAVLDPIRARDPFARFQEAAGEADGAAWDEPAPFGFDAQAATSRGRGRGQRRGLAGRPPRRPVRRRGRRRVEALLGPAPISIDDLARAADVSVRDIRTALIELELAGRLEYCGGNRVALIAPRRRPSRGRAKRLRRRAGQDLGPSALRHVGLLAARQRHRRRVGARRGLALRPRHRQEIGEQIELGRRSPSIRVARPCRRYSARRRPHPPRRFARIRQRGERRRDRSATRFVLAVSRPSDE